MFSNTPSLKYRLQLQPRVVPACRLLQAGAFFARLTLQNALLANGERFFFSTGLPLPSIVRYSDRFRYSFNQQRELVIEYGLKPLQFVRIEVDLPTAEAGIGSIAVEAVGDNIALGMRERGGRVDILNEIGTRAEGYESTGNSNALIDGDTY